VTGRSPWARRLLTLTLAAAFGCTSPPPELPPELVGRWVSADPRFAGRTLELSPATVGFETGIDGPSRHEILRVEAPANGSTEGEVTIHYAGEQGLAYQLRLRYEARSEELRLIHRPDVVWTREGAS
jgi:hypothetical protein